MKINSFYFFLFLWLLRCFTSPGLLYMPMYSAYNNSILLKMGSPIRKFPGQRLLGTSPKLIAPCNVLHRLLMSRHSPYALIIVYCENTKLCLLRNDLNHLRLLEIIRKKMISFASYSFRTNRNKLITYYIIIYVVCFLT